MDTNSHYVMADCLIGRYKDSTNEVCTEIVSIPASQANIGTTISHDNKIWTILDVRDFYPVDYIVSRLDETSPEAEQGRHEY
jgi:hypothetical protein